MLTTLAFLVEGWVEGEVGGCSDKQLIASEAGAIKLKQLVKLRQMFL